jgi:hypothetical protein
MLNQIKSAPHQARSDAVTVHATYKYLIPVNTKSKILVLKMDHERKVHHLQEENAHSAQSQLTSEDGQLVLRPLSGSPTSISFVSQDPPKAMLSLHRPFACWKLRGVKGFGEAKHCTIILGKYM